ncbi:hypothetical protein ES708_19446 [subsurface metagenome]
MRSDIEIAREYVKRMKKRERKFFHWAEIGQWGIYVIISVIVTVIAFWYKEEGTIIAIVIVIARVVGVVMTIGITIGLIMVIIPYEYILGKISQRVLEGLREEIKQELDELPEETLKLLKEEIEEKLIERKAEELYIKLGLINEDSLCKEESHKWR